MSKSKNNKKLYITEEQLRNLFMGRHKELILIYLKENRIKLNNKTINTILYYTIYYIKFNEDFYSLIFSLAKKYKVIKQNIINTIISTSNYKALIFLEKNNFGIFTLRDKLLSLISLYEEEFFLPLFKEMTSQNNISYKLRKELIIKSVNAKLFNFTLFLLNFEKPITSPLLKHLLIIAINKDDSKIFSSLYDNSKHNIMFYIEESIKSNSFNVLSFLYLTFTISEKDIIYIYKSFTDNSFSPDGVFFNKIDILRKIKQDYQRALINQKLYSFP